MIENREQAREAVTDLVNALTSEESPGQQVEDAAAARVVMAGAWAVLSIEESLSRIADALEEGGK